GNHVASGSWDSTIRIWHAHTGKLVAGPLNGHTAGVNSVVFSPDGNHVASGSRDGTIRIWDATTGKLIAGPFEGHSEPVTSVVFSPGGEHIVSGSDDSTIRIWDARTGKLVARPMEGHWAVMSVSFSPDGKHFVSGSDDGMFLLLDVVVRAEFLHCKFSHTPSFGSECFTHAHKYSIGGVRNYTIRIWDAQTGELVANPVKKHSGPVTSVAFSP
ncbi:WD40 repeat-like protein, partial [Athelia psychrophila]